MRSRLISGGVSLALYVGLIVGGFHRSVAGGESAVDTLPSWIVWTLLFVWFAANIGLVVNGNIAISAAACILAWSLVILLNAPEFTAQQVLENEPDGELGDFVFVMLGAFNFICLMVLHAAAHIVDAWPSDAADPPA